MFNEANVTKTIFVPSPQKGTAVFGGAYYTSIAKNSLVNIYHYSTLSDKIDIAFKRYSEDNGKTWSSPEAIEVTRKTEKGVHRSYIRGGYLDPLTKRFIIITNEGLFPKDNVTEAMKMLQLYYSVSKDGEKRKGIKDQIIEKGVGFDSEHPLPGVWKGKNSVMLGDKTCRPITLSNGSIIVPCQISPVDKNGEYINPGNGYTYHDSAVIIGKWKDSKSIEWEMSERIKANPKKSTRGLLEPTLGIISQSRILMIMRGSNEIMTSRTPDSSAVKDGLGGHKWHSVSEDNGKTWSTPDVWRFDNGETFYSPSACSQLLNHSNGKLYWIGNITPENPFGNRPRYPLVYGEVNHNSGLLIKESVRIIDTKNDEDNEEMTLSNFTAHEDRETGEIVFYMPRLFAKERGDWTADLLIYKIKP